MLFELMHRHRVAILVFMVLFIGLPMVFFIPGVGRLGGSSVQTAADYPVAQVGKTKVTAEQFIRRYNLVQEERNRMGQPAAAQDLVNDGTVDAILDALIREALITSRTQDEPVYPDRDYLVERLKDNPYFQNDQGEFAPGVFNQWVKRQERAGMDWDDLYADLAKDVNREVYMNLIGASARVFDREIREQFERLNTRLKIRAISIAPEVDLTEDELKAYYDENREQFMTPEQRTAEFVAVSLDPPTPPLVDELIQRARAGEDFAELAREYSQGLDAEEGGDLGWLTEGAAVSEHREVLFEMEPGDVRGPVESFLGLHIYKVIETRTNDQGQREVHARQILIRPQLSEDERQARMERIQGWLETVRREKLDLQTLAADEDLDVTRTSPFSNQSQSIEGVPDPDTFAFRREALDLGVGQVSGVVEGVDNLYLIEVVELQEPRQQTFEEARTDVERVAKAQRKQSPEYRERQNEMVAQIVGQANSIEDVQNLFSDQELDVKTTDLFGINDVLYNQGLFMDTRQLFARFVTSEPGEFAGPIQDLLRVPHFVELVDKEAPEGDVWEEQYQTEKDDLRQQILSMRVAGRQQDYLQHLVNQANEQAMIQKDYDAVFSILGLDETPAPEAPAMPPGIDETPAMPPGIDETPAMPEDTAGEEPVEDQLDESQDKAEPGDLVLELENDPGAETPE